MYLIKSKELMYDLRLEKYPRFSAPILGDNVTTRARSESDISDLGGRTSVSPQPMLRELSASPDCGSLRSELSVFRLTVS